MKVMNFWKRTWARGAQPIGAPGCPELALKVASTCSAVSKEIFCISKLGNTYRQQPDGVDGLPIKVGIRHFDKVSRVKPLDNKDQKISTTVRRQDGGGVSSEENTLWCRWIF